MGVNGLPPIKEVMGCNPVDRSGGVGYGGAGFDTVANVCTSAREQTTHLDPASAFRTGVSAAGDHRCRR